MKRFGSAAYGPRVLVLLLALAATSRADVHRVEVLDLKGASLSGALAAVARLYPGLSYIIARDEGTAMDVAAAGMSRDRLVQQILDSFGAKGTVVDDFWIVEAQPPEVRDAVGLAQTGLAWAPRASDVMLSERRKRSAGRSMHRFLDSAYKSGPSTGSIPQGKWQAAFLVAAPDDPMYDELLGTYMAYLLRSAPWRVPDRPPGGALVFDGGRIEPRDLEQPLARWMPPDEPGGAVGRASETAAWLRETPGMGLALRGLTVSMECAGTLSDACAQLSEASGLSVSVDPRVSVVPIVASVHDQPLPVLLVTLSCAAGVSAPALVDQDSYVLGSRAIESVFLSAQPLDSRISTYVCAIWPGPIIEHALSDDELAAIKRGRVPVGELSPVAEHVLRRQQNQGTPFDPHIADHVLSHPGVPVRLLFRVSWKGAIEAGVMIARGSASLFELAYSPTGAPTTANGTGGAVRSMLDLGFKGGPLGAWRYAVPRLPSLRGSRDAPPQQINGGAGEDVPAGRPPAPPVRRR